MKFEGEYLNGMKLEGIGYNIKKEKIYEIKNGNGKVKEFDKNGNLTFEGEYLNGRKMNGVEYDVYTGKKKYIIIEGNGCEEKAKDSWFFGERYSDGLKEVQEFYKNGNKKFEGVYIGDDRWIGKKYDINGENCKEIIAGQIEYEQFCLIF